MSSLGLTWLGSRDDAQASSLHHLNFPSTPPLLHCDAGPLPAPSGRLSPAPPTAYPLAAVSPSLAGFSLGSHRRAAPWPRLRLRAEGGWEAGPRGRGRRRAGRSAARCRDAICHCRAWAQAALVSTGDQPLPSTLFDLPHSLHPAHLSASPVGTTAVPAATSPSRVPHTASQSLPPCPRIKVRTPPGPGLCSLPAPWLCSRLRGHLRPQ